MQEANTNTAQMATAEGAKEPEDSKAGEILAVLTSMKTDFSSRFDGHVDDRKYEERD